MGSAAGDQLCGGPRRTGPPALPAPGPCLGMGKGRHIRRASALRGGVGAEEGRPPRGKGARASGAARVFGPRPAAGRCGIGWAAPREYLGPAPRRSSARPGSAGPAPYLPAARAKRPNLPARAQAGWQAAARFVHHHPSALLGRR
jgi:hypothetical protein